VRVQPHQLGLSGQVYICIRILESFRLDFFGNLYGVNNILKVSTDSYRSLRKMLFNVVFGLRQVIDPFQAKPTRTLGPQETDEVRKQAPCPAWLSKAVLAQPGCPACARLPGLCKVAQQVCARLRLPRGLRSLTQPCSRKHPCSTSLQGLGGGY
jgi:hypothetical protein